MARTGEARASGPHRAHIDAPRLSAWPDADRDPRVGAGTTVGAASVVTRDLPARHLCLGNPCRPVREV
jgi:hypothetical protein